MSPAPARLPRSIATVTLSGTLPDKLDAAARAGFDAVEIFDADLMTFDGSPADIRRIAGDLGLAIALWQPFRDFEAVEPSRLVRNLDRAERKFDVMAALGAPLMLVCSSTDPAALADDARAAADLAALAARAAARGLAIGYEALAWGRHVNRWRHAWRIIEQAGHPALGLILDSFHVLAVGDDLAGIERVPAEKLAFVQLADAPALSMDVLSWSRHHRVFPGQGQLPVVRFLADVLAAGYAGPLSLEIFNDEMRAAPARLTARDGLRSLVLLEAEARPSVPAAALPPPAAYDGIEFLEFAVDAASREDLARYLGTLGFAYAGQHRSKAVELYRQGRANLILNSEPDSAAAEHFHLHGPSVCAMAFRVDDPARAAARASALLAPPWHERTGAGERPLPAVRAPDGTLIFLVGPDRDGRSIYDDDFVLDPTAAAPDAALLGIDHVAQALPAARMDSFVLFYKAVFGFEPQPLWELPDPVRADPLACAGQRRPLDPPAAQHLRGTGDGHGAFRLRLCRRRRAPCRLRLHRYRGCGQHGGGARRKDAADPAQLLRRPGGTARSRARAAGQVATPAPDVRPRRRRRVFPGLHDLLPGSVLLRDRGAARLPAVRRRQRRRPAGGSGAAARRRHPGGAARAAVAVLLPLRPRLRGERARG